jgi:hypothetical protein
MGKLTDEELDSVFKNAAEGNEPPFDPTAWDAMAQKLNAPRPAPMWRKWTPLLLLGTTIFLTGVWLGKTSSESGSVELIESKIPIEENKNTSDAEEVSTNDLNELKVLPEAKNDVHKEPLAQVNSIAESRSPNLYQPEKQNEPKFLGEAQPEELLEVPGWIEMGKEVTLPDSLTKKEPVADSVALAKTTVDSLDRSSEPAEKRSGRNYGLFIRLLASPDLSSIDFGPSQLGSNFGMVGEFAFSERLSVSTGVILSKKNYELFETGVYGPGSIHMVGACNILDVPLNVTFYFPSEKRFSFYITAGASSYLMLREDYVYTVKSGYGDTVFPYQAIRKNNEWFKVLNVAVGVQYKLAPRWHIQIEPFIKAPLADLGDRNVRLSSMGVFGGLRYQLKSKP